MKNYEVAEGEIPFDVVMLSIKGQTFERAIRTGTPTIPKLAVEASAVFVPAPRDIQPVTFVTVGNIPEFSPMLNFAAETPYVPKTVGKEPQVAEEIPLFVATPNGILYPNKDM